MYIYYIIIQYAKPPCGFQIKNTPLQTMRILFSRLLIYMYVVCECARTCSGEWPGKELHTLLVKSAIYVNLDNRYIIYR